MGPDAGQYPWAGQVAQEEALVRSLGERIGYGRTMQLCEHLWAEQCRRDGMPNGAHAAYCCATFLVPCPGCAAARRRGEHCEWCCGAGRVTKRVARGIRAIDDVPPEVSSK